MDIALFVTTDALASPIACPCGVTGAFKKFPTVEPQACAQACVAEAISNPEANNNVLLYLISVFSLSDGPQSCGTFYMAPSRHCSNVFGPVGQFVIGRLRGTVIPFRVCVFLFRTLIHLLLPSFFPPRPNSATDLSSVESSPASLAMAAFLQLTAVYCPLMIKSSIIFQCIISLPLRFVICVNKDRPIEET